MANYGVKMTRAATSVTLAVGAIYAPGASPRRVAIHDVIFSAPAAGDTQFVFDLNRSTTAPTATAVVPDPLDPADPAATELAGEEITVQGTNTAGVIPLSIAMNQRSTVRWACREGKEIIIPATIDNGIHFNTPVAPLLPGALITAHINEL